MRVPSLVVPALLFGLGWVGNAAQISPLQCANPGSTTASQSDTTVHANSCTDFSYTAGAAQATPSNNWLYGYYDGTFNPTAFTLMHEQDPNGAFGFWANDFNHFWTTLDAFGGHPNSVNTDYHQAPYCDPTLVSAISPTGNCGTGPDTDPAHAADFRNQWAVRRYVVPLSFNGTVVIDLQLQKDYRTGGSRADGDLNYAMVYDNGVSTQLGAPIQTPPDLGPLQAGNAGPNTFPVQHMVYTVFVHGGDFIDFGISPSNNDFSDGEFQLITIQGVSQIQDVPEPATLSFVGSGLLLAGVLKRRKFTRPS
jgi:hypothetical protein